MKPETQTGKNIQKYVGRNKKRFRIINLTGKTTLKATPTEHHESEKEPPKESKLTLKMQKDIEFAKHIAQISQINGIENYIEQLAHNSQPILLRTKYKKMEEYISKKLKEEHGISDQNIIEAETAKAFIYTKLVRGGMYTLEKNMPSIYQDYTFGCLFIEEAIANKAQDIKIYVKYSMNKRKKSKNNINDASSKTKKAHKIQKIEDMARAISKMQEEIKSLKRIIAEQDKKIEKLQQGQVGK